MIPGLQEYVLYFLSEQMTGSEGMAVEKGLIPMPDAEREAVRAGFLAGRLVGQ